MGGVERIGNLGLLVEALRVCGHSSDGIFCAVFLKMKCWREDCSPIFLRCETFCELDKFGSHAQSGERCDFSGIIEVEGSYLLCARLHPCLPMR